MEREAAGTLAVFPGASWSRGKGLNRRDSARLIGGALTPAVGFRGSICLNIGPGGSDDL